MKEIEDFLDPQDYPQNFHVSKILKPKQKIIVYIVRINQRASNKLSSFEDKCSWCFSHFPHMRTARFEWFRQKFQKSQKFDDFLTPWHLMG